MSSVFLYTFGYQGLAAIKQLIMACTACKPLSADLLQQALGIQINGLHALHSDSYCMLHVTLHATCPRGPKIICPPPKKKKKKKTFYKLFTIL